VKRSSTNSVVFDLQTQPSTTPSTPARSPPCPPPSTTCTPAILHR